MKYNRPEVTVLGEAASAIQTLTKMGSQFDAVGLPHNQDPAYDLDE